MFLPKGLRAIWRVTTTSLHSWGLSLTPFHLTHQWPGPCRYVPICTPAYHPAGSNREEPEGAVGAVGAVGAGTEAATVTSAATVAKSAEAMAALHALHDARRASPQGPPNSTPAHQIEARGPVKAWPFIAVAVLGAAFGAVVSVAITKRATR